MVVFHLALEMVYATIWKETNMGTKTIFRDGKIEVILLCLIEN